MAGLGPELAKLGWRVAAPDMRGYGDSDRPKARHAYSLDALTADVPGLFEALGARRRVLIGHDWGGIVAWAAAMHPETKLDGLVVLNAPHPERYRQVLRSGLSQALRSWYVLFFQLPGLPEMQMRAGGGRRLRARCNRARSSPAVYGRRAMVWREAAGPGRTSMTRRGVMAALGAAALLPGQAFARARMAVPGAGSVQIPSPYDRKPGYPTYGERYADEFLTRYRNWRSTMSGHPEADGMLAVGAAGRFSSLADFVQSARAALSIQWSDADRIPGQAWDGNEQRWPTEALDSAGRELGQRLAVHRVGFFDVYDEPAQMYALDAQTGVLVAVWIYDKHGGLKTARRLAQRIAASHEG